MEPLTEQQREILAFERAWWKYAGAKDNEIRARFDCSPTRYYQLLNATIELPAAEANDPMTVRRLRRIRAARARQRSPRRVGFEPA